MLIVFELCHESHTMFVNVKKDYYSKVAHEMKFKTVKYVITKSTQATVTTPRNLNTVEPLLLMLVLLSFNLTNIICVSHDTIQAGSKNDLSLFFHYQTSARYVISRYLGLETSST